MTLETFATLVPAMVTFGVFFWGQVTLPRQKEKLENMIDLFHSFKRMEQLEGHQSEGSKEEVQQLRSSKVLVAIQNQFNSMFMIATLGLWKLVLILAGSLLAIAAIVLVVRLEVFARFNFLDNFLGDLVSMVVAEIVVALGIWLYLSYERKSTDKKFKQIDPGLDKYLEQLMEDDSIEPPTKNS